MTIQEKAQAWKECPLMTEELLQELHSMNDADREQAFEFLENNCKKYILKVPLTSSVDRYIIVYAGYHLLGIKRTSRLLHKLVLKMGCLV